MQAANLRPIATDAFVIFDELHHAGDDRAWGDGIRLAFDGGGPPAGAVGHAVPVRHHVDPVRPLRRLRRGQLRLRVRLRRGAHRRWRRAAGLLPPRSTATWSGSAPTAPSTRARSTTRSTRLARASDSAPRCRSPASGCRPCSTRRTSSSPPSGHHSPTPAGSIIAIDHEHAKGIVELMRRRHGVTPTLGAQRRPHRVGAHRALRRGLDAVDRRGAHGVRGRRHPAPARRRVRHQHRHRAVLPPGRRSPRAVDAGHAPPEGLLLHPRRSTPAHLRGPDRRPAPPQPAPPGRRRPRERRARCPRRGGGRRCRRSSSRSSR